MLRVGHWPNGSLSAFCIRDDDVNYFTDPGRLETIYRRPLRSGFKVTFGVVPAIRGVDAPAIPPEYRQSGADYELEPGTPISSWLQSGTEDGSVGVVLHGLHHSDHPSIPADFLRSPVTSRPSRMRLRMNSEFWGLGYSECSHRLKRAGSILFHSVKCKSEAIVPPQEYLSPALYLASRHLNLPVVGGMSKGLALVAGLGDVDWNSLGSLPVQASEMRGGYPRLLLQSEMSKLPHLYPAYRHHFPSFTNRQSAAKAAERAKRMFDSSHARGDYFMISTHHWEYSYDWRNQITSPLQLESLHSLLDHVWHHDRVWKCTLPELARWIRARKLVKVRRVPGGVKLRSENGCSGLTLWLEESERGLLNRANLVAEEHTNGLVVTLDLQPGKTYSLT